MTQFNPYRGFVVLLFLLYSAQCTKIDFDKYALNVNTISSIEIGMFSKDQTPFGSDESFVTYDLKFENANKTGGTITMLLFHHSLYDLVGKELKSNERYYCCWDDQVKDGDCSTPGTLLVDDKLWDHVGDKFQYANIVSMNETFALKELSTNFIINDKGYWRFWVIYCGEKEDSDLPSLTLNGNQEWRNPYGQLPATIIGYLPMFFILSLLYFVFGLWWTFKIYKNRKDLMFLQKWALFIIAVAFLEAMIAAFDYLVYNNTGEISLGFNVVTVLVSVTKRIASYIGLVTVTSGITIIKPNMEPRTKKIMIVFTIIYLAFSFSYQFVYTLRYTPSAHSNIPASAEVALLIFQTICDFIWLIWIFRSYFQSLGYLQKNKQPVKLLLFKRLGIVLLIAYIVSFVLYIAQYSIIIDGKYDTVWDSYWFFDGYWYVMHFVLTVVIGYMWRPNENNSRYAYSFQLNDGTTNTNSEMELSDKNFEIGTTD